MKKEQQMEQNDGGVSSVFSSLAEGCISSIIAWTSPKEACSAATVSWGFKSASESDTVWEGFLPADYKDIISMSGNPPVNYATKKELFCKLCHSPILINDGKLSFWLSKSSGKKCYMLCARELSIAWKDTPYYWRWTSIPESRFSEVAELLSVCWLDIQGNMPAQMLSLKTTYAAYLVYKLTEDSYALDVVAKAFVRFTEAINSACNTTETSGRVSRGRPDGWMELFLGKFYNDEGEGDIEMNILETESLNWKRGLILEGIELRPEEDA